MSIQKVGVFATGKDEETIIAELCEFFASKQIKIQLPTNEDLYAVVKQFANAAEKLAPTLPEKEVEMLLNAIFNLSITLAVEQSSEFNKLLCQSLKSSAFQGHGWNSHVSLLLALLSNSCFRPALLLVSSRISSTYTQIGPKTSYGSLEPCWRFLEKPGSLNS
jgi:hypothetical protein